MGIFSFSIKMFSFRRIKLKILVFLYLFRKLFGVYKYILLRFQSSEMLHLTYYSLTHRILSHLPVCRWAYFSPTFPMIFPTLKKQNWGQFFHIGFIVYTSGFSNAFSVPCSDKNLKKKRGMFLWFLECSFHK